MFEYMDGIVDAVEEIGQAAVDVAVFVTICTAKAVLIITAPVWILPYAIWRKVIFRKRALNWHCKVNMKK